ncbi:MAG: alanine--tRNA ligase [Lentisphaerae bacterium]|nr:alanine--tRNA ligase [Lentisphaerota bacterium]
MKARELRQLYLDFFAGKGHTVISGSSLIPQNDPTVLFTTAGMHPLVPFLLGEPHPCGKRLCNVQKCIRTGDIDEVGDASHLTFFEMLGNWSLGDYFKEEAIAWSFEFLTSKDFLGFSPDRLSVTVFEGNDTVPMDAESAAIWTKLGIPAGRIHPLPMKDNWWGPAGQTGPCGPDTEMFIDTGKSACGSGCRPGCRCGKYFEIWNDVFMHYNKDRDGSYAPLKQRNVDTGMGVERTVAMLQGRANVYETELFAPLIAAIEDASGRRMGADAETTRAFRVIADHVRSAAFILGDPQGVVPGNLGQGYVLRRLIRRAVRYCKKLGMKEGSLAPLAGVVADCYSDVYPELVANRAKMSSELAQEESRFEQTLSKGMSEMEKVTGALKAHGQTKISGRVAFRLYDTYGFPLEFTEEIAREQGLDVDRDGFEKAFDAHREVSKQSADRAFKGGLVDNSEMTTRLHTATHLLQKSLRAVLGDHVKQRGSNITAERLRFDFAHPDKMTPEQIAEVERLVNKAIEDDLPVTMESMTVEQARDTGAIALFDAKYGEKVKVYSIGGFSSEVCGGPHVVRTGVLGKFRIQKEESSSAGVRRIRAVLEGGAPVAGGQG